MHWQKIDIPETNDLKLTEAQEAGLKEICAIYNYPYELLSSPVQSFEMSRYGNYPAPPHDILNRLAIKDQHEFKFLEGIENNWANHRGMLLLGLHLTVGRVFEYGSGDGSTPYLREYCKANGRHFYTLESNKEWAARMGSIHVPDWHATDEWFQCGLAFVDLAPGEDRVYAIEKLQDKADIIVIHDTEEGGAGDYKFEKIWHLFKYRLNYNRTGGGAGATAVSNKIDLNQFRGLSLGPYKFDYD